MAKRYVSADPTAYAAVGRVMQSSKGYAKSAHPRRRRIVEEFPDVFAGLSDGQVKLVAVGAAGLAGGDVWSIRREHLEQARATVLG